MEKIFLKNGMQFSAKLEKIQPTDHLPLGIRSINLHKLDSENELIAQIQSPKGGEVKMHGESFKPYEIQAIAEIIENFDFFWNNLNQ